MLSFDENEFKQNVENALNVSAETAKELAEGKYNFPFKSDSPSSVLIGIGPGDPSSSLHRTLLKITLKSDYIEERVANKYLKMSWFAVLNESNAGNCGSLFESYVRLKFSQQPVTFAGADARESLRETPNTKNRREKKNYQHIQGEIELGSRRIVV